MATRTQKMNTDHLGRCQHNLFLCMFGKGTSFAKVDMRLVSFDYQKVRTCHTLTLTWHSDESVV
jgi:hypothetical protein